jgi:hypothetical protein
LDESVADAIGFEQIVTGDLGKETAGILMPLGADEDDAGDRSLLELHWARTIARPA